MKAEFAPFRLLSYAYIKYIYYQRLIHMKLSLSWIFDHIVEKSSVYPFTEAFVKHVIQRLGSCTTEIEGVQKREFDLASYTLAQLVSVHDKGAVLHSTEFRKDITVASQKDGIVGGWYLLIKDDKQYRFATMQDMYGEKEGLIPPVWCSSDVLYAGEWKNFVDPVDYIISIDNKAITHRPDLWGHRGFAREVAALLNMNLVPEDEIGSIIAMRHYTSRAEPTKDIPCELILDDVTAKRLAVMTFSQVDCKPSLPWMAFRLSLVDGRPLHAIVDCTNYVMFDIGQPMHVFDMNILKGPILQARRARYGDVLTLLDGQTITLTADDCVLADAQRPLALAGIMGGKESGVSLETRTLLAESANFDADAIRLSSLHHKRRTESSARFEKSLDLNQNTLALVRFKRLLDDYQVPYTKSSGIASLGNLAIEPFIELSHEYIVDRIGVSVPADIVVGILQKLGFGVTTKVQGKQTIYTVSVPTFRSTKDVLHKEDVLEEIARMLGYNALYQQLPSRLMKPLDHATVMKTRIIKQHCAYALSMHEVTNYAFYDEEFLKRIGYEPQYTIDVKNPVSEHCCLVTSLIPHLCKNVVHNVMYEQINLFEINTIWSLQDKETVIEKKQLALLFFSHKPYDFYEGKAALQSLFDLLHMRVIWRKPLQTLDNAPWYLPEQTAELVCNDTVIGYVGMMSPLLLNELGQGHAFIAELDARYLIDYVPEPTTYHAVSKYQAVDLDMSLLVPRAVTVDDVKEAIALSDGRIIAIQLLDFFEKDEWHDKRSMTLRFTISDMYKTLTKEEIDDVWVRVVAQVSKRGAQVR